VDLKTRLGRQKLRLDSLDDETRAECVEAAVARVSRLLPEDFVSRGTVVFATGRAI
jgi:hypothetical protein